MLNHAHDIFCQFHDLIEDGLRERLCSGELNAALSYAVFSGGKRTRPLLTLLAADACGGNIQDAVPVACAVELLHTASLILDDMPFMDDARERRGFPSLHIKFDEATAALAVMDLLNRAYRIFAASPRLAAEAETCVAEMIDGQANDLQQRQFRSYRKTTGLLRLSLTAGAIVCHAPERQVQVLSRCGAAIGRAYQMYDDVEDGDAASNEGAGELTADTEMWIREQFGERGTLLLSGVELMFERFKDKKPVAA